MLPGDRNASTSHSETWGLTRYLAFKGHFLYKPAVVVPSVAYRMLTSLSRRIVSKTTTRRLQFVASMSSTSKLVSEVSNSSNERSSSMEDAIRTKVCRCGCKTGSQETNSLLY